MRQYLDLLDEVAAHGLEKDDRTGVGVVSVFGRRLRFDLQQGFPLVTTKKLHWPSILHELLWFLRGDTNIAYLNKNGVTIWDEWADEGGNLGPIYGRQWRSWPAPDGSLIDQMRHLVEELRHNPNSRRLVVSAWNVGELNNMRLPPCHVLFQFYVAAGTLSCQLYQRSADLFLGAPFNIASYALLTHILAAACCLRVGEFIHVFGDAHIYRNHLRQVAEQLQREPLPLPSLEINPSRAGGDIDDFCAADIILRDYNAHPPISAPVAV